MVVLAAMPCPIVKPGGTRRGQAAIILRKSVMLSMLKSIADEYYNPLRVKTFFVPQDFELTAKFFSGMNNAFYHKSCLLWKKNVVPFL